MYYLALASDYDGTLAEEGLVSDRTIAALEKLRGTGRKTILVSGRELPDLKSVFKRLDLFDLMVLENGALLYNPQSGEERPLAPAPPAGFVDALAQRGVAPISVGHAIVATWEPHQDAVLAVIQEMGLELEIIFNKGAVMVLPSGVNKATGLAAALAELGLSPHNVAGVGDAENDHAFLRSCGCSVAVANALPAVKQTADLVTAGARGEGVEELIAVLEEDEDRLVRIEGNRIAFGKADDGRAVEIEPPDVLLIAGTSGIGKSTFATALTEKLVDRRFQFCVLDPEGDYLELENATVVGDSKTTPSVEQVIELLAQGQNVVVAALALSIEERPELFAKLLPELARLRASKGRPHWIVIDETHHLIPAERGAGPIVLPSELAGCLLITVHPRALAVELLKKVTKVAALGPVAPEVIGEVASALRIAPPAPLAAPEGKKVLVWAVGRPEVAAAEVDLPRQSHKRHTRKYAEGELDEENSFYFRGPDNRLNLRARNLMAFLDLAAGVDDATWQHHLRAGDYSRWFKERIKDDDLAAAAAAIEEDKSLPAAESRDRIAEAVKQRYTVPAA